ncbi:MAG: beta-propeller domain-containing protein, partial [Solirubrobacteraceae bacterium]
MRTWLAGLPVDKRAVGAVLACTGMIAALTMAVAPSSQSAVRRVAGQRAGTHRPSLAPPRAFRSCPSLVRYGRRHLALTHGVPETPLAPVAAPVNAPGAPGGTAAPAPTAGAPAGGSGGGGSSYSTTNNQEPGVDEPDTVKTNGSTIFAVSGNKLYAVSVTGAQPQLIGSIDLGASGYGSELLLHGTHLIVISGHGGIGPVFAGGGAPGMAPPPAAGAPTGGPALVVPSPYYYGGQTALTEVDVSDPAAMKVVNTITSAGNFVDARENGSTARVVISSPPPVLAQPALSGRAAGYVPRWQFHSMVSRRRFSRPVATCRQVAYPAQFSGLGMVTIFTINIDHGLWSASTDALMADAQIVYGSTTSLYLATEKWINPATSPYQLPRQQTTQIDKFDATSPDSTSFLASGQVPGYLLNQFSMSDSGGFLRVASTSAPNWWGGTVPQVPSQSYITVLATHGNQLTPVGQLSGLGAGQKIYSVRFVDNIGYVVTFRQVDPLYTLDLSDPTAPRVAGQLELQGYSSYLHPLGQGLLLGVGQDVGATNEPSGSQLELFDVSDPAAPRLVNKTSLGQGSSTQVNYDHHAFLYWPQTGLAVLPVQIYPTYSGPPAPAPTTGTTSPSGSSSTQAFTGAIGFHIDRSGIQQVGQISHPSTNGYPPPITRSIVIGGVLYTVSDAGILASSLDALSPQTFVPFPTSPAPPVVTGPPTLP